MALEFTYEPGQTPLDADEVAQLIPRHITTQGALNEWEQVNILQAQRWLTRARITQVLTEDFCRTLHRRMFNRTWRWAGTFRQSDKNIGCDWTQVSMQLRQLLDNTQYWLEEGIFPVDEAAARFHHQLVLVHGFPERQWPPLSLNDRLPAPTMQGQPVYLGRRTKSRG
ncbi:mobile mystery protein B [Polaromonas sp. P1-6]|nr:mobile mystery protein B [Polaromonas sp. P1-6]